MIYLTSGQNNWVANIEPRPDRAADSYSYRLYRFGLLPFAFAFCYALFLANLPIDAFVDRVNYFAYASNSDFIVSLYDGNSRALFANEPLWLYMNIWLSHIFDAEQTVRFFIFSSAFVSSFLLIKKEKAHIIWLIMFLFMPGLIKNYIIHIRQGVAIAIFMAGYYSNSKYYRAIFWAMTPFIHASYFFVLMLAGINYATTVMRFPTWVRISFFAGCYLVTALLMDVIASGVGARQIVEYENIEVVVSGLGFLFWTLVILMFLSSGTEFIRQHALPISILALYLGTYFIVPFAARILESGLFLILVSGLALRGWKRNVYLAMLTLFIAFTYFTQRNEPWFGWGL